MPKASSSNQLNVVRFSSVEIASRNAAAKLKEALNLTNNATEFEKLRNAFRLLGQDYLKADEAASTQRDVAESIKEMLVERYPDLYQDGIEREERLTLTIQLIYQEHNRERAKRLINTSKISVRQRSVSMRPRAPSVLSLTSSEPDHSCIENNHNANSISRRTILPYHRYLSKALPPANSASSSSSSSNTLSNSHASSSQTTLEDLPMSCSSSTNTNISSDKTFIAEFLDTCIPTMLDLLDKFLSFGCNCESHIRVISKWDSDSIYDFLQRVSKHGPGPITEMDMRILETHFSTYFK